MELIGRTTINPFLFYSGKVAGYITWIILFLLLININVIKVYSLVYNEYIAFITFALGLIAVIISLMYLGSSTRLGLPTDNTELKTNGIYSLSRNPMYLGFNLLTISSAIYTLNFVVIILGIYSIIIYHLIILGEEKYLSARFGDAFKYYKKTVRRYI